MKMQFIFFLPFLLMGCNSLTLSRLRRQSESYTYTTILPSAVAEENFQTITEKSPSFMNVEFSTDSNFRLEEFNDEWNNTQSELEELFLSTLIRNVMESDDNFDQVAEKTINSFKPELPKSFFVQFKERWGNEFRQEYLKTRSAAENEKLRSRLHVEKNEQKNNSRTKREAPGSNFNTYERNKGDSRTGVAEDTSSVFELFTEMPPISQVIANKDTESEKSGQKNNEATLSDKKKELTSPDLNSEVIPEDKINIKRQSDTNNEYSDDSEELEPLPPLDPLYDDDDSVSHSHDNIAEPNLLVSGLSSILTMYARLRSGARSVFDFVSRLLNN